MMASKNWLNAGEGLSVGDALTSPNGLFQLVYETDGNLVLYAFCASGKVPLWTSDTRCKNPGGACFEADGNLAVYDATGFRLREFRWAINGDAPHPNAKLTMQDDANVVAYDSKGQAYWATNTWICRFALLIGVETYGNYPEQRLRAGRNDVLVLWQVCRRLGYKPEHIRVRTSPPLEKEQIVDAEVELALGQEKNRGKSREEVRKTVEEELAYVENLWGAKDDPILGDATYEAVKKAVTWLRDRLGEPFTGGKGFLVPGFLAYSGHGARLAEDLALCPSDVKWAGDGKLENALTFGELQDILIETDKQKDEYSPTRYLTTVLDCCFAGPSGAEPIKGNQVVTSLARPAGKSAPAGMPRLSIDAAFGQRIFCASQHDEHGCQALLGGRWHGAFTWAFTQALEQWTTVTSGLFPHFNVSHVELLFRTRMLLEALSFSQHPMLMDSIGNTPVFWSGSERIETRGVADRAPGTGAEPDRPRDTVQIDPSEFVQFGVLTLNDGTTDFAKVVLAKTTVTLTNGTVYQAGSETWYINGTPDTARMSSLVISVDPRGDNVGFTPPSGGSWKVMAAVSQETPFSAPVGTPPVPDFWQKGTASDGTSVTFGVQLSYSSSAGRVTWFSTAGGSNKLKAKSLAQSLKKTTVTQPASMPINTAQNDLRALG